MDKFKSKFFINNRARLRSLFTGTAPIVLTANGLLQSASDITYPFRQDSNFWYFTGINLPGVIMVMDKTKEYLILPNRSKFSEIAEGALDLDKIASKSGISMILDQQEGWRLLTSRIKRCKHVAVLAAPAAYIEEYGFYTNPARAQLNMRLKDINDSISFLDIREHIMKQRVVKQPEEIEAIKQAINITTDILKDIKKNLSKYKYENEVEAFILSEYKRQNVVPAFPSIVAAGKNACIIHYELNNSKINEGDFLLVDIGSEVDHYASDLARTFGKEEKLNKRQRQVFNSVVKAQNFAFSLLKAGVIFIEYERQVEHFVGEQLRELGLIKTIDRESVRRYFPTATSHYVGLDTHDVGDYKMALPENAVIAVEPGIYIPEEGIGVRMEDDVLITNTGIINLSANLPSTLN